MAEPRLITGPVWLLRFCSSCLSWFRLLLQSPIGTQHVNNRNGFLTVVEAGDQVPAWSGSSVQTPAFFRLHWKWTVEKGQESSGVPCKRTLIAFTRAPPLWPKHVPKASPPNTITPGVRILMSEFWGAHSIHCMATRGRVSCHAFAQVVHHCHQFMCTVVSWLHFHSCARGGSCREP